LLKQQFGEVGIELSQLGGGGKKFLRFPAKQEYDRHVEMEDAMTDHVYKLTEIVGTSHDGSDAAIKAALERAQKSIRNIRWYEVVGSRGYIEADGKIMYQVTLKVGFTLDG
jgi:flavin-binding protein dodecin